MSYFSLAQIFNQIFDNTNDRIRVSSASDTNTAPKLSPPALADYCSVDRSVASTEVFTYKSGGASGTLLRTLTIVYSDLARTQISTITSVDP